MKPFHDNQKKTDFREIHKRSPLYGDYIQCVIRFYLLY